MDIRAWLTKTDADVSIRFQALRDLYGANESEWKPLRARVTTEGWGAAYLAERASGSHWGTGFYTHKWTNSHYTLLELRNIGLPSDNPDAREVVELIAKLFAESNKSRTRPAGVISTDLCIDGMFLNYACFFGVRPEATQPVVDYLLAHLMPDGGFNCESPRPNKHPKHSSLHTTISVLEGIQAYEANGYTYRLPELLRAAATAREFILRHRLFRSDHTGAIIDPSFLMLSCPWRWRYDILRALDHFREAGVPYDERMDDALEILAGKQRKDGAWPVQNRHPGKAFIRMERTGGPSRWNTLRALRVLNRYDPEGGWL